jgi:hypothetical protein
MRTLLFLILTVISTACASVFHNPVSPLALERPEGRDQVQVNEDTSYCNDASLGSQSIAVDCMQRRGYRLVRNPAR